MPEAPLEGVDIAVLQRTPHLFQPAVLEDAFLKSSSNFLDRLRLSTPADTFFAALIVVPGECVGRRERDQRRPHLSSVLVPRVRVEQRDSILPQVSEDRDQLITEPLASSEMCSNSSPPIMPEAVRTIAITFVLVPSTNTPFENWGIRPAGIEVNQDRAVRVSFRFGVFSVHLGRPPCQYVHGSVHVCGHGAKPLLNIIRGRHAFGKPTFALGQTRLKRSTEGGPMEPVPSQGSSVSMVAHVRCRCPLGHPRRHPQAFPQLLHVVAPSVLDSTMAPTAPGRSDRKPARQSSTRHDESSMSRLATNHRAFRRRFFRTCVPTFIEASRDADIIAVGSRGPDPFGCAMSAERVLCREVFLKRCCVGDEGCGPSASSGGGRRKPPHAALAKDRRGER